MEHPPDRDGLWPAGIVASFLTFGSLGFECALSRIEREAAASSFFETIAIKRPGDLDATFWRRHGDFVRKSRRGFGYWIWKPWLIHEQLCASADGDFLVYADAGCTINPRGGRRLREYFELAAESPVGVLGFQLPHLEKCYTKGVAFAALNGWAFRETGQVIATAIVMQNGPRSRDLIREWRDRAERHDLISDERTPVPNDPSFLDHRHDQSLFSLLAKQAGAALVADETGFSDPPAEHFPIWATRKRGRRHGVRGLWDRARERIVLRAR